MFWERQRQRSRQREYRQRTEFYVRKRRERKGKGELDLPKQSLTTRKPQQALQRLLYKSPHHIEGLKRMETVAMHPLGHRAMAGCELQDYIFWKFFYGTIYIKYLQVPQRHCKPHQGKDPPAIFTTVSHMWVLTEKTHWVAVEFTVLCSEVRLDWLSLPQGQAPEPAGGKPLHFNFLTHWLGQRGGSCDPKWANQHPSLAFGAWSWETLSAS